MCEFRVMTFNIRGADSAQDGVNAWENRASLNVRTILDHAPDLIGFQELQAGNLATYEAPLSEYRWVLGPATSPKEEVAFNPIFWRRERFQRVDSGGFWLNETPGRPSLGWDAAVDRGATWVRLACRRCGVELLYVNTHLDHRGERARTEGVKLILRQVERLGGQATPVTLTGDFNCSAPRVGESAAGEPGPDPYRLLIEGGFVDAYLAVRTKESGTANTFHRFQGEAFVPWNPQLSMRIDWIMTRDGRQRWRGGSCSILRKHRRPLYPSDHYPVLADLDLRSGLA